MSSECTKYFLVSYKTDKHKMSLTFAQEDAEEELLSKALYIDEDLDSTPFDSAKLPATGEEYLRSVIREAKTLEGVSIGKRI